MAKAFTLRLTGEALGRLRFGILGFGFGRDFPAVDGIENFLTVNWNILGRDNPKAYLITTDFNHRDGDVIVNDDALVFLSGQH